MKNADENRLIIDASRVAEGGEEITGEVACVDLQEPFVKSFGGVRYCLTVQNFGAELLVRGTLEQDFDLVCSRCGKEFDDTIKVGDFTMSYEIAENKPEIDITEDVRESVILALPSYALCDENCPGIAQKKVEMPMDERWSGLDDFSSK